jgi:predicted benzoate:H+ symporter BenE
MQNGAAGLHSVGMTGPLERIMNKQLPERIAALVDAAALLAKVLSLGAKIKDRKG